MGVHSFWFSGKPIPTADARKGPDTRGSAEPMQRSPQVTAAAASIPAKPRDIYTSFEGLRHPRTPSPQPSYALHF